VTLEPAGIAVININQALADKGIAFWATLTGYMEIQYLWPWDALCVTIENVDVSHSLILTYGLRPSVSATPTAPVSNAAEQVLEGLWWKQEQNVSGFVALSNLAADAMQARLQVSDAQGSIIGTHHVTVSAHGTKLINLPELQGVTATAGGIRIDYSGPDQTLIANGGLEDQASGYSATMPIIAPPLPSAKAETTSVAELGLMTGTADPMMSFPAGTVFTPYSVLRNVSERPIQISSTLWWMEGGAPHSAQLRPISLPPGQTQNLDMPALLASAGLKNFNGSLSLALDSQGPARGLIIASGSVDQKNTYVFEVRPVGVQEGSAKSLAYWSIGNGDDTMVTLWNPADEAQDFIFTLFFTGGHYDFPIHLGPRVTNTFNISEIVHNQIPDAEGNVVPVSIHEGSARISGTRDPVEHIMVGMAAGVYNVVKATCAVICYNCNGTVAFETIDPNPLAVGVSNTGNLTFTVGFTNGSQYNYTASSKWTTSNTSIATVQSAGVIKGVTPGSFTTTATGPNETINSVCCSDTGSCPCIQIPVIGTGPGTVVQVTSVAPSPLVVGSGGAMAIGGSGFLSLQLPITVSFDGSGITVTNPTVNNDGSISATYSVASNTATGSQNLTVSSASSDGGQGAHSNPFPVSVVAIQQGSVTGITPAQGLIGTTLSNVTITGSGFGSSPTVNAGSGITVTYVSRSNTSITADFAVASNAPAGNNNVVVTTSGGAQLAPVNFFVQIPTHFQRFDQPPEAPGGLGPVTTVSNGNVVDLLGNVLRTGFCGVYENFLFDIADQQGNQIENGTVTVKEVFSNITNPPGPTPATTSVPLSTNGVTDNQAYGFNYPTCPAKNQNQTLDMSWTVQVGSTVYPITTVVYITKGNFNGTLNVTSSIITP
jgi:hypothetical protein